MIKGVARGRLCRRVEVTTTGGRAWASVPPGLPPKPALELGRLISALDKANLALGRLDGMVSILPDPSLFLYTYMRKEAALSSQIEGTQSTLSDLLLFESEAVPGESLDDVVEVSNYVAAMEQGLKRLKNLPLSNRLLREIHKTLLRRGRGAGKDAGEFRRSQNWIGGESPADATFVPPPPELVPELMSDLETFIHRETEEIPPLIKAGLVHAQFESIHPFLDGNGRLGRLLITFMLREAFVLREPLLYLSLFFKTHRARYYEHLQNVHTCGDWEGWLDFFLEGVAYTSRQVVETAQNLMKRFAADRRRIEEKLGRAAGSALRVHRLLQEKPVITIPGAVTRLRMAPPTIDASIMHLLRLGVVHEMTGRRRGRVFVYRKYLDILSEGTEPLPR